MLTKFFITILTTSLCNIAIAQDFQKQFKDLVAKKDTAAQGKLLKEWEISKPTDPELFVAYINFYVNKAAKEIISIQQQGGNQSFQMTDSAGHKWYLTPTMQYDARLVEKGFDYIDKGIGLYPARLDMRLGKIYMLGEIHDFAEFTKEIIETIEYGNKIKNEWLWKEGKPLNHTEFLLSQVQGYVNGIYQTEDDDLLPYIRQISETVLKYYPNHVESLSNVALTYLINKEYDKALTYLLKAETIAPSDVIVLNNIAEAYKRKADKVNAKIYYQKVIKYGEKEQAADAKQRMKDL